MYNQNKYKIEAPDLPNPFYELGEGFKRLGKFCFSSGSSYVLASTLFFCGSLIQKGCEFNKNEFSTRDVRLLERNIGNEFSGTKKTEFLKIGKGYWKLKVNEEGDLEGIVKMEKTTTELETGDTIVSGTEYILREYKKVELKMD